MKICKPMWDGRICVFAADFQIVLLILQVMSDDAQSAVMNAPHVMIACGKRNSSFAVQSQYAFNIVSSYSILQRMARDIFREEWEMAAMEGLPHEACS